MKFPYNPNKKNSIIEFAKLLIGKSVNAEYRTDIIKLNLSNKDKGQLGKVIEELYFKYKPNSSSTADFKKAGLELKSSGLKQLKKTKSYVAKERLSLSMINFLKIVKQDFDIDFLNGKNGHLLLIFYLYQNSVNQLDSIIKLVGDWKYPLIDIEVIRKDWETIKQKVLNGKAHELSEGDTNYLGACRKGNKDDKLQEQPFCKKNAKKRAFSLKPGYVNHIIASISKTEIGIYGKLITSPTVAKNKTIEDVVISKFKPLYGKTVSQLIKQFNINGINPKSKNFHSNLSKLIVKSIFKVPDNMKVEEYIEEFKKAEIKVKTVRLDEKYLPKEEISFPAFKYVELIKENWDDSKFKEILEHKYLFVFFQYDRSNLVLRKVKFWNMPYQDIKTAKKVWDETISVIKNGNIVEEIKNGKRYTNFPGKKFNFVSHVRPHAKKVNDTYPLPIQDKVTKANAYTKHCFWLNNTYVRDKIYKD